jgi:hypothetical protein
MPQYDESAVRRIDLRACTVSGDNMTTARTMTIAKNETATTDGSRPAQFANAVLIAAVAITATFIEPEVHAANVGIDRFFGIYEGVSNSVPDGETAKRNLHVTIQPYKDGFSINAQSEVHAAGQRAQTAKLSVDFRRTTRNNIYMSAMRLDLFGNPVSLDPLEGGPYIWARLSGDTLTVYILKITDAGAQDLRIYKHTVTAQGMDVEETRFRDSEPLHRIDASLKKVGQAPERPPAAEPTRPIFVPES